MERVWAARHFRPYILGHHTTVYTDDGIFAGHFSELKVYDKLCRLYWWPKMRAKVRNFYRSCLNCALRKGPGRAVHLTLQLIPMMEPFHRVGVDVLKMPLSSSGNKYIILFMDTS